MDYKTMILCFMSRGKVEHLPRENDSFSCVLLVLIA
jgi:hypothetical protein